MDKSHQMKLISGIAEDYLDGSVTLMVLIQKIEGLLDVMADRDFRAVVFDDLLALDEVYARTCIGDFDFAKEGKPIVESAVRAIMSKTRTLDS